MTAIAYFDEYLPAVGTEAFSESELRVFCYVLRQTVGYADRELARLSLTEIQAGAGVVKRKAVIDACRRLMARGVLRRVSSVGGGRGRKSVYCLNLEESRPERARRDKKPTFLGERRRVVDP